MSRMRCQKARDNLTAWLDGALSSRWDEKLRQHLAGCSVCTAAADSLRKSIASQRNLLVAVAGPPTVNVPQLWVQLQRERAAADTPVVPARLWWLRPAAFASAAVAASVVGFVGVAGGPEAVLIPLGVKAPPPAVKRAPVMFKEYSIIQKLDILEHFDTVEAMPLEEDAASEKG